MVIQPNSIGPPPLWKTSCAPRMYQAKSQESGLRKVFNYWIRLVGSRQNFKTICQSSNDFDQYDLQFWLRTTSHLCSIWGKFDSSRLWVCFFGSYRIPYVMRNIWRIEDSNYFLLFSCCGEWEPHKNVLKSRSCLWIIHSLIDETNHAVGYFNEKNMILLMEEILHHLGCIKPCK